MLGLQKDTFARYVAQFQREGEERCESWTLAPSFHSPGVPVPRPLLPQVWALSSPDRLLQTQGFRRPAPSSPQCQELQPQPLPPPPSTSHPLYLKNLILSLFLFVLF